MANTKRRMTTKPEVQSKDYWIKVLMKDLSLKWDNDFGGYRYDNTHPYPPVHIGEDLLYDLCETEAERELVLAYLGAAGRTPQGVAITPQKVGIFTAELFPDLADPDGPDQKAVNLTSAGKVQGVSGPVKPNRRMPHQGVSEEPLPRGLRAN